MFAGERMRGFIQRLVSISIVALLALAGYLGHRFHWAFPSFEGGPQASAGEPAGEGTLSRRPAPSAPALGEDYSVIAFASAEAVLQAGIGTAPAVERPLDVLVRASASISYDQTKVAQLAPRAAGIVWKVNTHLGQFVRSGDVLAVVDAPEVGQAKAELLQDYATHTFKAGTLRRLQELGKEGAISERMLREAQAAAWEARNRLLTAQQRLINLGFDFDLKALEGAEPEELALRVQLLGLPKSLFEQLRPRPRSANLIPLCAPFDGVVTRLDWVVGERVTPDNAGIILADVRSMWVKLAVRKESAARLALGQRVQFVAEGAPAPSAEGEIHWISTEVDEKTRTVYALAEVPNPPVTARAAPRRLRANQYGTALVLVDRLPRAVLVPAAAVQRLELTPLVFVALPDGQSFQPRKVELGDVHDGLVHVRSGLAAGARVVTTNSYVLKSELMRDTLVAGD